jgi:transposase
MDRQKGSPITDPRHPRKFSEKFKRQIVQLYDNGKSPSDIKAHYDIGSSTLHRWIWALHENRSTHPADDRTPEQARILERKKEKQAAQEEGQCFKNDCADIYSKVAAVTANAGRYPISAQCKLLGVPRFTYYKLRDRLKSEESGRFDR